MEKDFKEVSANHDAEKHGYDDDHKPFDEGPVSDPGIRRTSITTRLRGSVSVQKVEEDAIEGQMFSMNDVDPALDAKMRIVNQTIDQIGWTNYHLKLFFLSGFGYMADSLILLLQSVTASQAAKEYPPDMTDGLTVAAYSGMLIGALFWGFGADVIGRKVAFNCSLFICSISALIAGCSVSWYMLGAFTALCAFGGGGNLVLDTTVFLEFLPGQYQWLMTLMACWWGLAPVIAAGFAWPLLSIPEYYCHGDEPCNWHTNIGWRAIWWGCGGLILVASVLRITIIKMRETPKYLLSKGQDAEVVECFQYIAKTYNRPCDLTLERLEACGQIRSTYGKSRYGLGEIGAHLRGLFATKKLGFSTSMIWLSWTLIGLAYPLFYVFLPQFLASRGAKTGEDSPYYTWRNYLITNTVSIFGPIAAGFMCECRYLGRRYTMAIGALITMAFFFAYTDVRTAAENIGFTCAIYFFLNIYYGCLYAYTPEVLPSAHRATGYGIAIACNRVMGLVSAFVAQYSNTATSAPVYLCAALYIAMAFVAVIMPFEPYGRRSM